MHNVSKLGDAIHMCPWKQAFAAFTPGPRDSGLGSFVAAANADAVAPMLTSRRCRPLPTRVHRLPKPPSRTFGLLRFFPEKMEKFRRTQLEAYLQELLAIPEALANRAVLSFLGLVSSSRWGGRLASTHLDRGGFRR